MPVFRYRTAGTDRHNIIDSSWESWQPGTRVLHQSPGGDEVFNWEVHSDNKARLEHALKKVKKESYKVEL